MFKPVSEQNSGDAWRNVTLGVMMIFLLFIGGIKLAPSFFVSEFSAKALAALGAIGNARAVTAEVAATPLPPMPEIVLPERIGDLPARELFGAKSILVKDRATGAVLYGKNEYEPRPIASLTKLMSALLILERNPDWTATASVVADDVIDTHMYAGDTHTLRELWQSGLVGSSNKAILTLVDATGPSREAFVARMNEKAMELGMANTQFTDPTGLDAGNIATPSDLAMLIAAALATPPIEETLNIKELTLYSKERKKTHHLWNTNWLLLGWIPNNFAIIHGGKTGFITESGYNFGMRVEDKNRRVLDVVVLGADSHEHRFTEAKAIAEWAFANYKWPQ